MKKYKRIIYLVFSLFGFLKVIYLLTLIYSYIKFYFFIKTLIIMYFYLFFIKTSNNFLFFTLLNLQLFFFKTNLLYKSNLIIKNENKKFISFALFLPSFF